ncbi:YicC/YloC family endoribonuclease [Croceimicrobium sp.]|uniref:YicC/YloC family endoribonuclease n=1 Tax=Croceimicrobium sp. TaxID=2828340 RepID=UPI003BAC1525
MTPLYSMTGFGKKVLQLPGKKISIEMKSLNSKQADINLRLPSLYRSKEGDIRQLISESLIRGKIDCNINVEITGIESAPRINMELAEGYLKQLKQLSDSTGTSGDILGSVMRLPDVLQSAQDELGDEEWKLLEQGLLGTLEALKEFRASEGSRLAEDLQLRLQNIEEAQAKIVPLEEERRQRVKDKLMRSLEQLKSDVDQERFEQELIYYLEKYDITEEKVRLSSHIQYFRELMEEGNMVGKKLGFVSQEIGREINTLGSKANHAEMQRLVVEMKDELEKIKEQALNIL